MSKPTLSIDRRDNEEITPYPRGEPVDLNATYINAWFPDRDGPDAPPMTVGGTFRLHVNLGPMRGTPVDDWKPAPPSSEESVDHVTVVVRSGWFDVKESSRRLDLPANPNNVVEFTLTAKGAGTAEFAVIFLVQNDPVERREFTVEVRPADAP